jgi:transposase
MWGERGRLLRHVDIAKAVDYMLRRWPTLSRFLDDGRICPISNTAERRPVAKRLVGNRGRLSVRIVEVGAAAMYSPIAAANLNGVDTRAWLLG